MQETAHIHHKVDHLFRHEYGKLVSVLTKAFGTSNLQMAEDVVQDAMVEAIQQWTFKGVPDNPVGWIYRVARNKAVNVVNHEKQACKHQDNIAHQTLLGQDIKALPDDIFTDQEIADDQLRMMFTCCNPAISPDSQIALTLKTLCGFSIPEIASAFLSPADNINKRLVRARKQIREANLHFEIPVGTELESRLASILETIYLLFNEGYSASSGTDLIRYELCEEAIRLAEIIVTNPNIQNKTEVHALLALMALNAARFSTRLDENDHLVDLENQDRAQWDQDLIQKGLKHLELSVAQSVLSIYHVLATISAYHCTATDFASTDWESILSLYDHLTKLDKSPIILLNRAIVMAQLSGPTEGLDALNEIPDTSALQNYLPYYTTLADFHAKNGDAVEAVQMLEKALSLSSNPSVSALISKKLEALL